MKFGIVRRDINLVWRNTLQLVAKKGEVVFLTKEHPDNSFEILYNERVVHLQSWYRWCFFFCGLNKSCEGQHFSYTGKFIDSKDFYTRVIRLKGGKVQHTLGPGVTCLVAGPHKTSGTKLDKAKARGIKIISEKELYELLQT